MSYTKEPWEAFDGKDNENDVHDHIGIISDGWYVARVWSDGPNPAGDARLIAAAPDLLEALRELLDHLDAHCVTIGDCNQAHAAIAKAEGRK